MGRWCRLSSLSSPVIEDRVKINTIYQGLMVFKGSIKTIALLLMSQVSLAETFTYSESNEDINNPDRGFYYPYTTSTSNFTPLVESELIARRTTPYLPFQGTYTVTSTIALRHYVLDSYVNTINLPATFLDHIQADFDVARSAGIRLILRFSYTVTPVPGNCAAGFICPPYNDASKPIVLSHIQQLADVISANTDVIMSVQQGFVGTWGENYYSDFFGDPSPNDTQGYLTNQNWLDRNEVVNELLQSLPANRMVQVRYPQAKQRLLGGPTAPLTTEAITASQAFSNSPEARLGIHNDCFLASEDDLGTFADYGNDDSPVSMNNSLALKNYAQNDSIYTLVGGETCSNVTFEPQNDCESVAGGMAVTFMQSYHYTYLNSDYNNEVNNDWQTGACMSEIKRRLGYRLVLNTAELPLETVSGEEYPIALSISNVGFAAAINPREVRLILRNTETAEEVSLLLNGDNTNPQFWLSGETITVSASPVLSDVEAGNYALFLHLADASDNNRIRNRPEFSIQFANQNSWESNTGYNDLRAVIKILPGADTTDGDILDFLPAIIAKPKS